MYFHILKDIKPEDGVIGSEGTTTPKDTSKKPVLRFGPGLKPSGSKGVEVTTPKTEAHKSSVTPSTLDEERPKSTGGLRGSGLKIADK